MDDAAVERRAGRWQEMAAAALALDAAADRS